MAWHSAPPCATLPATLPSVSFVFTKETAVGTSGLESVAWSRTADDRYYLRKESQGIHYYLALHFVDKWLRLLPEKWSSPWSSTGPPMGLYQSYLLVPVWMLHPVELCLLCSKTVPGEVFGFSWKGKASLTSSVLTLITVFSSCQQSPMDETINSQDKNRWTANTSKLKWEKKGDMK